jgi:hypothetical protein
MPTFYVADDIYSFRSDCKVIEADNPAAAAEEHACEIFDSGDADTMRPIEVIVAEDAQGKNAARFVLCPLWQQLCPHRRASATQTLASCDVVTQAARGRALP